MGNVVATLNGGSWSRRNPIRLMRITDLVQKYIVHFMNDDHAWGIHGEFLPDGEDQTRLLRRNRQISPLNDAKVVNGDEYELHSDDAHVLYAKAATNLRMARMQMHMAQKLLREKKGQRVNNWYGDL